MNLMRLLALPTNPCTRSLCSCACSRIPIAIPASAFLRNACHLRARVRYTSGVVPISDCPRKNGSISSGVLNRSRSVPIVVSFASTARSSPYFFTISAAISSVGRGSSFAPNSLLKLKLYIFGCSPFSFGIVLLFEPQPRADEVPVYRHKQSYHACEDRKGYPERDIGDAEEAVAETVDEGEDRVHVGKALCPSGERVYRVEDAAEIDQGREHEGRDEVEAVDTFGVDAVDQAREREHERG